MRRWLEITTPDKEATWINPDSVESVKAVDVWGLGPDTSDKVPGTEIVTSSGAYHYTQQLPEQIIKELTILENRKDVPTVLCEIQSWPRHDAITIRP